MLAPRIKRRSGVVALAVFLAILYTTFGGHSPYRVWGRQQFQTPQTHKYDPNILKNGDYFWKTIKTHYVVQDMRQLPKGRPQSLPRIQRAPGYEDEKTRSIRLARQSQVKKVFQKCWKSYVEHGFLHDELKPVSGGVQDPSSGWGTTMVESLGTLWIMGLKEDFDITVNFVKNISFMGSTVGEINVYEANKRNLAGLLSAFDMSGDERLLKKALELGEMLYVAFDTPNRLPITHWDFARAASGELQEASPQGLLAEIGSFSMEFTRLSFITGNPKWFDASERITGLLKSQQASTQLPGLWPISNSPRDSNFAWDNTFSLGAMADSVYEYLPKMTALTGGLLPDYQQMYQSAVSTAMKFNFFRPMVPDEADILISGVISTQAVPGGEVVKYLKQEAQHLTCFVGGMLAMGSRLYGLPDHLEQARKLTDGCIWTYRATPTGLMPDWFSMLPCRSKSDCKWNKSVWKEAILELSQERGSDIQRANDMIAERHLPTGFTSMTNPGYNLRPEAIESVFILYRVTGERRYLDAAWEMWNAIIDNTATDLAYSAIDTVAPETGTQPKRLDRMEPFWMGQTLKYFYLIFSDPEYISLDEFAFNTEGHPLRRLTS